MMGAKTLVDLLPLNLLQVMGPTSLVFVTTGMEGQPRKFDSGYGNDVVRAT